MKNTSISLKILYCVGVVLFVLFTLGPILWAFIISITPEYAQLSKAGGLFPDSPTMQNFALLFSDSRKSAVFWLGMKNSLITALITIAVCVPLSVLSGYALSRMHFRGRRLIKRLLLLTMAIPVLATIIPIYKVFSDFHLLDNMPMLALVYVTSFLPINTWLMSSYFETIPREIEEASYLDGCGPYKTFLKTILPLSLPAVFACILMCFITSWNQFQIPMILASSVATKPVSVVVSEFETKDTVQYGLTAAAGILAVIPPALVAVLFRRFLTSGVTGGAVKE